MTPFQLFELWSKRASVAQRTVTALAVALVVALLGWLVTPSRSSDELASSDQLVGPAASKPVGTIGAPGAAPVTGAGPNQVPGPVGTADAAAAGKLAAGSGAGVAVAGVPSSVVGQTGGAKPATGPAAPTKTCLPTVDTGTTAKDITVAVTILDAGSYQGVDVNDAAGVPSVEEQRQYFDLNFADINAAGGAACRKLVPRYWNANPLDNNGAQQVCLQIAASKPFLVIDTGTLSATNTSDCIPQHKIPMVTMKLSRDQMTKYAPFYLSPTGAMDENYRTGVQALSRMGIFTAAKGFKRYGLVYQSCHPKLVDAMKKELAAVGVSSLSTFDMGCPTLAIGNDNSKEITQAVLQFKREGVTHLGWVEFASVPKFTQEAARQSFTPQYLVIGEYSIPAYDPNGPSSSGPNGINTANFEGAIAVIGSRSGEQATPGFRLDPKGQACQNRYAKGKVAEPNLYKMKVNYGGAVCALTDFSVMLINAAPSLHKNALVANIRSLGEIDLSFPLAPQNFALEPANTPWARMSWRAVYYKAQYKGFQVTNRAFQKPFL